ncbi:MAG TPA: hypothetical protein VFA30_08985 [Gaiellaceae bacterium]|nr:hypothetical protein [Gaiellaceae bacterium]
MSARAHAAPAGRLWVARARGEVGRALRVVEALPVRRVLAGFVAVQWATVLALALVVRHAGWIYYQGGDQLWLYTSGWLLGHGHLTQTRVGYGWPAYLAPIARIAGANLVSALPVIVLVNVLVLLPASLLSLYGIARRIGGRLFGYWAVVVWIALPFFGILYTNEGYHQKYTELSLPQLFGLTAMADMPTAAFALVSAYFFAKVLFDDQPALVDAVAAGTAAGVAIAIKPATSLFLVGPALALAYRRRIPQAAAAVAGIAPAVITLAVWKERGLGQLPALARSGVAGLAAVQPLAALPFSKYLHQLNWPQFRGNLGLIQEHFWSVRLLEWVVLAGVIALARRSRTAAILVGAWFFAFAIVKGSFVGASVEDSSLLRLMIPAFPALVLLVAGLPFLLPGVPRRARVEPPAWAGPAPRTRWALIGAVVLLSAVVPLAAFAAASTGPGPDVTTVGQEIMPIPANIDIGLTATRSGRTVSLAWRKQTPLGGPVFFRIWRSPTDTLTCSTGTGGSICNVTMPEVGTTHADEFVDRPKPGRWVYRVAVAANWLNSAEYGDPYLVSRAVTVTVP